MHQDLHCLLRQNRSSEKEIQYVLEIITRDPQYIIKWAILTFKPVSNFMGYSIGIRGSRGV